MEIPVRYGLVLGFIVAAFGFVLAMTDLHTHAAAPMGFVIAATILNVVIVVLATQRSAPNSNWGRQVLNGLVLGVVAAVIVFLGSWVMTTVVFPDYYAEYFAAIRDRALEAGMSGGALEPGDGGGSGIAADPELQTLVPPGTAVMSASSGAVGTIITSIVVAAIAGYFKRSD